MSTSTDDIRELLKGTPRVLLVEGDDDKKIDQRVYETWLNRLAGEPGSARVPLVVAMGSKSTVIQRVKDLRPEVDLGKVRGLVDRDEWDDAETTRRLMDVPGLQINLSRHCLESYFCEPAELNAALARSPIANFGRATKAIAAAVESGLASWVGHWALWATLERLKNRMSEAAYPNAFHQGIMPPAEKVIKAKLAEWAAMIDVGQVMIDYRALRKASLRRPASEQLRSCTYAKNVFPQVVIIELNRLRTEYESNEWMPLLANWFPEVPADIAAILNPLLA